MMPGQSRAVPHLVVLAPDSYSGRRIELAAERMTVGREPNCDVRFDDPHVSRAHAVLQRRGDTVHVQDLGSTGGTSVNGIPATAAELHGGDIVAFATVRARFEAALPASEQTQAMPAQASRVNYAIDRQDAGVISNVAGDQYNAHIHQLVQQRDNFLREIAATKTRARWLIWSGLLLFVAGFTLFAAADLNFLKQISHDIQNSNPQPPTSPFGHDIAGIPSGLLGWALAAIGALMLMVGIVLHIVAASRRRRVERDFAVPVPWPLPQQGEMR